MIDAAASRILHVNPPSAMSAWPARVTVLQGLPGDSHVLATARHWVGSAEAVLVLQATGAAEAFSLSTLHAYGALVSYRSYLVCLGTLFGQPWLGYSSHQYLQTIREFTGAHSPFVIDRSWNRQLISTCPSGFLRKVGGVCTAANYDASLDTIAPDQPSLMENQQ
jgi:hypothetical protein